jgi:hypothetical protein
MRQSPDSHVLLTTLSDLLANALQEKLRVLAGSKRGRGRELSPIKKSGQLAHLGRRRRSIIRLKKSNFARANSFRNTERAA